MALTENAIAIQHPAIMATPWFMFSVLGLYLFIILRLAPAIMKHRKPYKLKKLIITHNITQVLSCIYVVYEVLYISEFTTFRFWKCSTLEKTHDRTARQIKLSYFLFFLKISELIETVIFVLRNKQNQVTKLHVFHHIVTVTLVYMLINHNLNGTDALFPVFLNSIVHIIMYSYYLTTVTADKRIVRALTPIKKSITVMQMVQFMLILIHAAFTMTNCGVPKIVFIYYIFVIVLMFYGFYDFYQISYKSAKRKAQSKSVEM